MKLKKMMKRLKELKKAYGNLPVLVYADHGQVCTSAHNIYVRLIDENGDEIDEEDLRDEYRDDYSRKIVIDG
jgi:hypothetical protein